MKKRIALFALVLVTGFAVAHQHGLQVKRAAALAEKQKQLQALQTASQARAIRLGARHKGHGPTGGSDLRQLKSIGFHIKTLKTQIAGLNGDSQVL